MPPDQPLCPVEWPTIAVLAKEFHVASGTVRAFAKRHQVLHKTTKPVRLSGRQFRDLYAERNRAQTRKVSPAPVTETQPDLLESYRSENASLKRNLKKLTGELGLERRVAASLVDKVVQFKRPPKPAWINSKRIERRPEVDQVFVWSDWHGGDKIQASEVESLGAEVNWQILSDRLHFHIDGALKHAHHLRAGFDLRTAHVLALGDFIHGELHESDANEFPITEQVVRAGHLLGEGIERLQGAFDNVQVHAVRADNHGRLDPKPRSKSKDIRNWNHVVYEIARQTLHDRGSFHISPSTETIVAIQGWRFLCFHGDSIRSWGGVPYNAIDAAIQKECQRRMFDSSLNHFDYMVLGHFHVPAFVNRYFVNGSLTGTTEYDYQCKRWAQPSQITFLVGQHGPFAYTPWDVSKAPSLIGCEESAP